MTRFIVCLQLNNNEPAAAGGKADREDNDDKELRREACGESAHATPCRHLVICLGVPHSGGQLSKISKMRLTNEIVSTYLIIKCSNFGSRAKAKASLSLMRNFFQKIVPLLRDNLRHLRIVDP